MKLKKCLSYLILSPAPVLAPAPTPAPALAPDKLPSCQDFHEN